MSTTNEPFLEHCPSVAWSSYNDPKQGIGCIFEGLRLVGKAAIQLLTVVLFLIALSRPVAFFRRGPTTQAPRDTNPVGRLCRVPLHVFPRAS